MGLVAALPGRRLALNACQCMTGLATQAFCRSSTLVEAIAGVEGCTHTHIGHMQSLSLCLWREVLSCPASFAVTLLCLLPLHGIRAYRQSSPS